MVHHARSCDSPACRNNGGSRHLALGHAFYAENAVRTKRARRQNHRFGGSDARQRRPFRGIPASATCDARGPHGSAAPRVAEKRAALSRSKKARPRFLGAVGDITPTRRSSRSSGQGRLWRLRLLLRVLFFVCLWFCLGGRLRLFRLLGGWFSWRRRGGFGDGF